MSTPAGAPAAASSGRGGSNGGHRGGRGRGAVRGGSGRGGGAGGRGGHHHQQREDKVSGSNLPAFFQTEAQLADKPKKVYPPRSRAAVPAEASAPHTSKTVEEDGEDAADALEEPKEPPAGEVLTYDSDPALFTKVWGPLAPYVLMDAVLAGRVTPLAIAEEMARFVMGLEGISASSSVTDATAGLGGNTLSFARKFARVNAIEIEPNRCEMLVHNMKAHREKSSPEANIGVVKVYAESSLDIVARLKQDVIFVDPPVFDSKTKDKVRALLGGHAIHEVVAFFLRHAKYVVLKLPINAERSLLEQDPRLEVCSRLSLQDEIILAIESTLVQRKQDRNSAGANSKAESLLMNLVKNEHFHRILYKCAT